MQITDISSTLQLPKTDFPMKANLAQAEPARIAAWKTMGLYEKIMARPAPKGRFVLPDGPPYANGFLHVGHALNKILKDMILKHRNMSGYHAAFVPGWDCHGLPIELNVTKKLGPKRKDMSPAEVRGLCREEALSWVAKQKTQFERLGVLADWENPWLTLTPEYEADEIRVLAKILANGIFYRGDKPVYWCPTLQTALAAAEVEYRMHKSLSIFVKFPFNGAVGNLKLPADKPVAFLIWTTTPWTLPANYGVALNPSLSYGIYDVGSELLILAEDLSESVAKETGLDLKLIGTLKGEQFDREKAEHPFLPRESLVVLGDHVTLEAGSGVVHTAPGHGLDDYVVGMRYGLPVHSPVNEAGRYTDAVSEFAGQSIWEANPKIVEKLRSLGQLVSVKEIEHQYPHNPRSKTPLIFRATPQWFIRMDDEQYPLRDKCLEVAEKDITYVPKWGAQRLHAMLANSPDWCVSRQRTWGVPVPVFYCEKCKAPLANVDVMNRLADKMESSKLGIEAYHSLPPKDFTQNETCAECGHSEFTRGQDILDVWFDSGVAHMGLQRRHKDLGFPADVYLEGSDQHRGWFQTSLVSAMASEGKPPFKALITHNFVNDAKGYKMSKSLGNTVDPEEIIKESGAEILRLWVSHEDYGQDLTISKEMIARISDTYRRFRNTIRFMLGNLNDFDPVKDRVEVKAMTPLDQWILHELNELVEKCGKAFETYEFFKAYHAMNNFFAHQLSATYLDILKDRLYTGKATGPKRRAAQTAIYDIVSTLCGLMAPIASFLAEETYAYLPGPKLESVFLTNFPQPRGEWINASVQADFAKLLEVRAHMSKELEELRRQKVIGSSLDAEVTIQAPAETCAALEQYTPHLREFLMVSAFQIKRGESLEIKASKAGGEKCPRCWHYDTITGSNPDLPGVCPKCVEALS